MTSTDSAFQVGDRVVCVDDGGAGVLHNGREYIVSSLADYGVSLAVEGVVGNHFMSRFRRAPQANDGEPQVPRVGDVWWNAATGNPVTITSLCGPDPDYPITYTHDGYAGSCTKNALGHIIYRAPPPELSPAPVEAPLVVGAEYEGLGSTASKVSDQWFRGKYLGPFVSLDGHSRLQESDDLVRVVQTASLKRIPDAGEGKAKCPRCGAAVNLYAINPYDDKCDTCGVTGKELRVAKARDPYKDTRAEVLPNAYAAWEADQNARHRAAIEKHKADLDRTTREREAVLARNTKHWAPAWSSPDYESDH